MFRKKPKTMTEPTSTAQPEHMTDAANANPGTGNPAEAEMQQASEAASEHGLHDADPQRNEEVERLTTEVATLNDKHLRLFSVYHATDGTKFWVITEADRSSTTVLLPEEY